MASIRRRTTVLMVVFAMLLSLFALRLFYLQVLRAGELSGKALDGRIAVDQTPAVRGDITDSTGIILATSIEVRNITADQTMVLDPAETARVLAPMLDMPEKRLVERLTGTDRFVYLKREVDPQVWRGVRDWRRRPDTNSDVLRGVFNERTSIRQYPNKQLGANVVGFVNDDREDNSPLEVQRGASGLEAGFNELLSGTPGLVRYERAVNGAEIPASQIERVDPVPGADVRLTLDADLQWIAQEAITKQALTSNSDFGMVVVLEVETGRVLAMATGPSFDPDQPLDVDPQDWANKPITWAMEPGSTAKLMTIASVLDEGAMTPRTRVDVPGSLHRGDKWFKDSHEHGLERLTLAGVLAQSSNIGTVLAAESIGGRRLYERLKEFGVGSLSGLNYPGEASGYVPDPKDWSDTTFPTLAFGQGLSMSAMQIASMVAAIGNDGVYVPPRLVDAYEYPDGTVEQTTIRQTRRVLRPETAATMQELMELVLQEGGTATNAVVPGYLMGGKTGTAQRFVPDCQCYSGYTASFVGMAPATDPQIVVGAWVENPKGAYYGGTVAAPVVQEVMTAALASQNIPPTGDEPASYPLTVADLKEETRKKAPR